MERIWAQPTFNGSMQPVKKKTDWYGWSVNVKVDWWPPKPSRLRRSMSHIDPLSSMKDMVIWVDVGCTLWIQISVPKM